MKGFSFKGLIAVVFAVCIGFMFVACGDDESSESNADFDISLLYGTWYWEDGLFSRQYVTFFEGGTLVNEECEFNDGAWHTIDSVTGTWICRDNTLLIITFSEGDTGSLSIVSISSSTLVLLDQDEVVVFIRD